MSIELTPSGMMACDLDPADRDALRRRTREILHQCYKFGFEYHKELDRKGPLMGKNY